MTAPRPHPNADILAQLAEIAKTDPEPWEHLEVLVGNYWLDCNEFTKLLDPNMVFRIKPTTVNIGGMELEGPLRCAPENGTKLWLLFDHSARPEDPAVYFAKLTGDVKWLNEGRLFASKEARDKYQDALLKLANGEIK